MQSDFAPRTYSRQVLGRAPDPTMSFFLHLVHFSCSVIIFAFLQGFRITMDP